MNHPSQVKRNRPRSGPTTLDGPESTTRAPTTARAQLTFAAVALPLGWVLLGLSTVVTPGEPFILATVLLALAVPALVLTRRESGGVGVRRLLRDCVRMPRRFVWLPIAALALPALSWVTASSVGGAQPLTPSLIAFYVADLVVGVLVVNLWEEMAWTGFFQRRAMSAWGGTAGGLVTALFFSAIHIPLAIEGATDVRHGASGVLVVAVAATGLRLVIGRLDTWTGRSLLTIGVLHSSFNATQSVLTPEYDWVRVVVTVVLAVLLTVACARRPKERAGTTTFADMCAGPVDS